MTEDNDLIAAMIRQENENGSGFEPDPEFNRKAPCFHQSHRPPTGMVIPIGQRYRHVCPGCKEVTFLKSHRMTC